MVAGSGQADSGFDVMLGNPPWERVKLQEKEWFSTRNEAIATASNAAKRKKLINGLQTEDPPMHAAFLEARRTAEGNSHFLRDSGRYPLCGRGDVNTYTVFTELIRDSLSPRGRSGCVVPSGIATDDTTKFFFQSIVDRKNLVSLFDFENAAPIFAGVHRSYKFCTLTLGSDDWGWEEATFAFFLHRTEDLEDDNRVFTLTADDIALVNPNTRTCPIFRTKRDAEITKGIYRRVPVLVNEHMGDAGNPWGVTFNRMFDMTNDSHLFHTREELEADGWALEGNVFVRGEERMLPLYEGRMIDHFDHRAASVGVSTKAVMRDGLTEDSRDDEKADPKFCVLPRYWLASDADEAILEMAALTAIGFKDVSSATNRRTFICANIPSGPVGNKVPLILRPQDHGTLKGLASILSSFVFDFIARQKMGGVSLNFFIVKQLPVLAEESIGKSNAIDNRAVPRPLLRKSLELSTPSLDLGIQVGPNPEKTAYRYSLSRRFQIRCELDAAFFHLYGIERDDVDYIMDTFPIVKRKDEAKYGSYRTKDRILQIYDEMAECMASGTEWQSPLDPPPGDPRAAWTEEELEMWRQGKGEHLIEKYGLLDEETC